MDGYLRKPPLIIIELPLLIIINHHQITISKWMIWGYPHFRKAPNAHLLARLSLLGDSPIMEHIARGYDDSDEAGELRILASSLLQINATVEKNNS